MANTLCYYSAPWYWKGGYDSVPKEHADQYLSEKKAQYEREDRERLARFKAGVFIIIVITSILVILNA